LVYNTVSTNYTTAGINTSLGHADFSYNVMFGINTAEYIKTVTLLATGASFDNLTFQERDVRWTTITDANGIDYTVLARDSSSRSSE
jgi:hypothetical protein